MRGRHGGALAASALLLAWLVPAPAAQHGSHQPTPHGGHHPAPSAPGPTPPASAGEKVEPSGAEAPRRVTMEELHRSGGVPRGWKFAVPAGDAARGRALFSDLECYKCHAVKDGGFPPVESDARNAGPELTGMGGEHPAAYIAESILAPNHVIVQGPGYTGPDGLSVMPSFADSLSVTQWLDLVAYLKSLTKGGDDPHAGHEIEREMQAGAYRVRLVFMTHGGHGTHGSGSHGTHGGHGTHSGHGAHGGAAKPGGGHLMAFITDPRFDEPVPYLPVTATVYAPGRPPQIVRLAPMLSDRGFHYGADVALPASTARITVAIGATTMAVPGADSARFKRPISATFPWSSR